MNTIKKKREEKGMSREELAEKVGVTRQMIYLYETKGIANARLQTIKRLSETLDFNIDEIKIEEEK